MATTIELQVAQGDHDSYWTDSSFYNDQTQLRMGQAFSPYRAAMLFSAVQLPPKCQINSAYLSFYVPSAPQAEDVNVNIYGNYVADASAPSDLSGAEALSLTSRHVNWDLTETWPGWPGEWSQSPDISTVIQEIVDHPGWAQGNNLQIIIRNGSTLLDLNRSWAAYEMGPSFATKLTISYQSQRDKPAGPKILVQFNVLGLLLVTSVPGGLIPTSVGGR